VLQRAVPVLDDDTPETLAARVQAAERELVPEAVRLFAAGRLALEAGRVRVLSEGGRS
jgi:phosphoribosylglycinamide formyltransferase-1